MKTDETHHDLGRVDRCSARNTPSLFVGAIIAVHCIALHEVRAEDAAQIAIAREALAKHYETQRLISKEENDWKLGREILQGRIDLMQAQIEELKKNTVEQEEKTTETDKERLKLVEELEGLDKIQAFQKERVGELEEAVRAVVAVLPELDSLRSKVQARIDKLPDPDAKEEEIKASLSERYLNVLAILKFTNEFHRNIELANETRKLADGREMQVRALYLGLGHAYFTGGEEGDVIGGVGFPSAGGWQWKELPESADEIKRLIDIYEGKEVADFVSVPAEVVK